MCFFQWAARGLAMQTRPFPPSFAARLPNLRRPPPDRDTLGGRTSDPTCRRRSGGYSAPVHWSGSPLEWACWSSLPFSIGLLGSIPLPGGLTQSCGFAQIVRRSRMELTGGRIPGNLRPWAAAVDERVATRSNFCPLPYRNGNPNHVDRSRPGRHLPPLSRRLPSGRVDCRPPERLTPRTVAASLVPRVSAHVPGFEPFRPVKRGHLRMGYLRHKTSRGEAYSYWRSGSLRGSSPARRAVSRSTCSCSLAFMR